MNFSDYQQACSQLIKDRRTDYANATPHWQQCLLEANTPFECVPSAPTQQAVLLIHGLYDSPCIMQSLKDVFLTQNYLVRSVLLPGHGTRPEDLCSTTFEEWLSACRAILDTLPNSIERIVLAGFSTGGLLSHYLALSHTVPKLIGIVALAPALQLHPMARFLLNSPRLVKWLSRISPWCGKSRVADYAKYTHHALNGAHQVQRLISHCQQQSPRIPVPVFWVLSSNDNVIDSQAAWQYFSKHAPHTQSRCLIYSAIALNFTSDQRYLVRTSQYPLEHIENFSHVSLAVAPDHPHYGRQGDYTKAMQATLKRPIVQGESGGKTTLRLTYNPDFDYMAECISTFLMTI